MGEDSKPNSKSADMRFCARCRELDLSMAGRNLSVERNALAQRAGSLGRYTPMTDVGVRVADLRELSRITGATDCPLCNLIDRHRKYRNSSNPPGVSQEDDHEFLYAFSTQYCFQETGMGPDHNFLVVLRDLDGDETYGMESVIINGQRIHGINNKLHPDFSRLHNRYLICHKPSRLSSSTGFQPRAISTRIDISILKKWLEDCQASHSRCSDETKLGGFPPDMRLIDCQRRSVVDVRDISQVHTRSYVALSYVWGGSFHPPMREDARLPVALPQVIEDAIQVTLATGYRYLWVDQYCIDQSDNRHKSQQIRIMDRIYSSAAWTIVDGAGEDANHGLVGISCPRSEDLGPVLASGGVELFHWPSHSAQRLNESTWATRAWTYQEAFFSKRIVMFTATGLYFECQEIYENEGLIQLGDISMRESSSADSAVDNRASAGRLFPSYNYGPLTRSLQNWAILDGHDTADGKSSLHDFWRRVKEYTCRQMTYPEDSLAAFRGVLQFYVRRAPTHDGTMPLASVCGIPFSISPPTSKSVTSQELSLGLCWSHAHGSSSRRRPTFPSWSWAGWIGQAHGGSDECVESLLWGISFETVDSDGSTTHKPWYDMDGQDSEVLLLDANVIPSDALSITPNGQWDVFGLGSHARFDMDEDIRYEDIFRGLLDRSYVIVPVVLLNNKRTHNDASVSARMLLLRRNLDSFERVGLFIFGGSLISFKLINLINEGIMSWDRETLRII